ncbi:hypothetical protein JTE90_013576 [Oedothorax gibbosus]|uniref:Peptidase metallopeptidase domain-containing protein n=1 Tax=Oedothorax gibbosus TaxID=931172 RepID=A0AAV6VGA2_9ARAC|nr:hypothetical protein JTE90_013576 [Oedothorax gibbosus]
MCKVYLTQYGYLPASDPGSGNLRSERHLKEAIRAMQRFGHLKPTGIVDGPTLQLMKRRRCGVPDVVVGAERVRRYALQGQKWPGSNLTWSVISRESDSDIRMVRSQLLKAFEVWSAASALTFVEVEVPTADIVISFLKGHHGDGYPFDGEGSVLAHAFFPGAGIGGDAHFDAEERWLASQPEDEDEGVNLFAVAAHEIGHSLGLSHSSTPGSLMFPYYQLMGEYFTLPKDDMEGIRHLYGSKDQDNQPTMPTILPNTSETKSSTTTKSQTTPTTKYPTSSTKKSRFSTKKTTTTTKPERTTQVLTTASEMPDACNSSIDAISVIRGEVFVFKGRYFWRLHANRTLRAGYPVAINRFWHALPADIEKIDALYERLSDTKIMFFTGKNYWLFTANQLEPGYPRPLTDLGLPQDLDRIDVAIVWGYNGKAYFFSGKEYWKFDELEGRVELDYPRNINNWRGLPTDIDAAFQWTDGNTYFFKGSKFWRFMDVKMKVDTKGPSDIGNVWFNCSRTIEIIEPVTTQETATDFPQNTAVNLASSHMYLNIIVLLFMYRVMVFAFDN